MALKATEFIRRFLLHVLPSGFVRIRHYGFLANCVCREKLAPCRTLPGIETSSEPVASESSVEPNETVQGQPAANVCPSCGKGQMVLIATIPAIPVNRREWESILEPVEIDTS